MSIYSTLADAIRNYTGLSPAAFFTIAALMIGAYRLVCSLFVAPEDSAVKRRDPAEMPAAEFQVASREPVPVGDITPEELRAYDGSDPKKPLLIAIKGNIYDVSISRNFYGPNGPYALFAGRDATRALALMSFDHDDLTNDVEGLSSEELEVLEDWELKFKEKYPKVGQVVIEKGKAVKETVDAKRDIMEETEDAKGGGIDVNGDLQDTRESIDEVPEIKNKNVEETENVKKDKEV